MTVRIFEGRGDTWKGWRFTLEPQLNECGSEGFRRVQLAPAEDRFESVRAACEHNEPAIPGYTERMRKAIENPDPDWVEAAWLPNWLAAGMIREVKP